MKILLGPVHSGKTTKVCDISSNLVKEGKKVVIIASEGRQQFRALADYKHGVSIIDSPTSIGQLIDLVLKVSDSKYDAIFIDHCPMTGCYLPLLDKLSTMIEPDMYVTVQSHARTFGTQLVVTEYLEGRSYNHKGGIFDERR